MYAAISGASLLAAIWLVIIIYKTWLYWKYRTDAEIYIPQIENFKKERGIYPDEEVQTIVPDSEGRPYFYESNGIQYCIGFNIGFDYTYRYCSTNQKWIFGAVGPIPTHSNAPR
jgi:hypothetical protein